MHHRTLTVSCHSCGCNDVFHSHLELRQEGFTVFINRDATPSGSPKIRIRCRCGSLDTAAAGVIAPSTTEPVTVSSP